MTDRRTFLLGVGAQKAGTTWLHRYLVSSPNVAQTILKEYHIWDGLYIPSSAHWLKPPKGVKSPGDLIRYSLQRNPEHYFKYFCEVLDKTSKRTTCDITPSYAGLNRIIFNHIKTQFEKEGILTKAIFLMRDPVERCWSAARMNSRNTFGHTNVTSEMLLTRIMSDGYQIKTRYDLTIEELEASFDSDNVFIGLYERLADIDQLSSLSKFCNVDVRPALMNEKHNVSPKVSQLDINVARKIARHYQGVYEFVARKMPIVEQLWSGYEYL